MALSLASLGPCDLEEFRASGGELSGDEVSRRLPFWPWFCVVEFDKGENLLPLEELDSGGELPLLYVGSKGLGRLSAYPGRTDENSELNWLWR